MIVKKTNGVPFGLNFDGFNPVGATIFLNSYIMKATKFLAILLFLPLATVSFATGNQQEVSEIIKKAAAAIQSGNVQELTKNFNKTIELDLLGEENFYSQVQAEILLKDFFTKNKPLKFSVNHQGVKETTSYAIGIMSTKGGDIRVSIFIKTENGKSAIHQLRFETDKEETE